MFKTNLFYLLIQEDKTKKYLLSSLAYLVVSNIIGDVEYPATFSLQKVTKFPVQPSVQTKASCIHLVEHLAFILVHQLKTHYQK